MSILRRDPMDDFVSLRREMSRLMDDAFSPFRFTRAPRAEERAMQLPLDAYATAEEIVVTAAVPGLDPDDVEVTLEGNTLTIRGRFRAPLENVDYLIQERPYGSFSRSLTINVPIEEEQAEAKFEKGILMIILPKTAQAKAKVIEVRSE
ncbi:MAG: Hsp20/alpha crystallin family protein [Anaerolineae bacterium]